MHDNIRADLQTAGRLMIERGLTWGNAGNISARSGPDTFLITASGARLGELTPDDFVHCPMAPDAVIQTERKPSKELPMHRAIYEKRPEINVVLHGSPGLPSCIALTDPMLMLVLKSGSFGSPDFFARAIEHLKSE